MIPRIIYRPLARTDLLEIAQYLAQHNLTAAEHFIDSVEHDISNLAEHPGMGAPRRSRLNRLKRLRSLPVTRYRNYLIFYIPIEGGIEIVRILHGARRLHRLLREQ